MLAVKLRYTGEYLVYKLMRAGFRARGEHCNSDAVLVKPRALLLGHRSVSTDSRHTLRA